MAFKSKYKSDEKLMGLAVNCKYSTEQRLLSKNSQNKFNMALKNQAWTWMWYEVLNLTESLRNQSRFYLSW